MKACSSGVHAGTPSSAKLSYSTFSSAWLHTVSDRPSTNRRSMVVSVISAAPWAILSTRWCRVMQSFTKLDRIIYRTLA